MSHSFVRTSSRILALLPMLALSALAVELSTGEAQAQTPPLFSNYYVPPYGGPGAQLYISPRPTPARVGHVYYTYQPVMPHEFMTPHRRCYYGYMPDGGWTCTKVRWSYNPFNQVWHKPQPVMPNPRSSGHLARKFGAETLPVHEYFEPTRW